jgi:DNA processing protein
MDGRIRSETGRSESLAVRRLARQDAEYPAQLREDSNAPEAIYVRGALMSEDALAVAVVGARAATPYGLRVAEALAGDLATRGVTVVSGLARGIDGAAHLGALRAGGRTVAVLGSGVDVIYPPEHRRLAAEIQERGALVSQFPPGTPPRPFQFPVRNRVIAGMTLGVVVVEAGSQSGALITARLAGELGREVMAVPGRVTSAESRGVHALIKDGAALVESVEDVIAALPARWRECVRPFVRRGEAARGGDGAIPPAATGAGDENHVVLSVVGEEPVTMDEVIDRTGLASGRAAAVLLELELAGRVRQIEGKRFVQLERRGEG